MNIASRADSEQWLVHEHQILLSTEQAWKKRESREARGGYCITCRRGIRGWPACENRDRTRAIEPQGFPKTLTRCASVHRFHACTWTRIYNSLDLLLNSFSSRLFFFALQIQTNIVPISSFLFSLYNAWTFEYFFLYLRILLFTSSSDREKCPWTSTGSATAWPFEKMYLFLSAQ